MKEILDEIEAIERKLIWFDRDEKYTFASLWPVGTRLVNHWKQLTLFSQYPYLGFMSCDPDSGKSRALKVVLRLSGNPELEAEGCWTAPSLLDAVYRNNNTILEDESGKPIIIDGVPQNKPFLTIPVEELDEILVPGKDNSQLIQFFNLGYEAGKTIRRKERFSKGEKTVHCFCPKLFSGLYAARLKPTTRSRTAIYSMLTKPAGALVQEDVYPWDYAAMESLRLKVDAEYRQFIPRLANMAVPDINLPPSIEVLPDVKGVFTNRDLQLVKGVLGIAYLAGDDWYQRALQSAKFFFGGQNRKVTLAQQIIRAMLRIYLSGAYVKGIHTKTLILMLIDEHGFNKRDLDEDIVADALKGYDPDNYPRGIRLDTLVKKQHNLNGYLWANCLKTFSIAIPHNIVDEILADVDSVEDVGNARLHRDEFLRARAEHTGVRVGVEVSTVSTGSTDDDEIDLTQYGFSPEEANELERQYQ